MHPCIPLVRDGAGDMLYTVDIVNLSSIKRIEACYATLQAPVRGAGQCQVDKVHLHWQSASSSRPECKCVRAKDSKGLHAAKARHLLCGGYNNHAATAIQTKVQTPGSCKML